MMRDKGQVGIVVAILLVVLLVSVLAVIQLYYVPRWMEEREAEHMDVAANQFANLKYAVDLIAMEKISSPLTTSITLGSKELPYFLSSRSFGSIQILSGSMSNFSFSLEIDGYEYEEKENVSCSNTSISNIISISSLELNINKLNIGDYYNISFSDNSSISVKVDDFGDYCRINLTVKKENITILNQTIFSGIDEGSTFFINLMDEKYAFSTKVLPYITKPFNATFSVSNGIFSISYEVYKEATGRSFSLGTLIYQADNAYFVDQNYIYEGGAVFLSQHDGNTTLFPPSIEVANSSINFTLINITPVPGKAGAAGYGTYLVRVNYSSFESYRYFGNITLKVVSNYNYSWNRFLNKTFNESGINYDYDSGSEKFELNEIEFVLNVVKIYAQVGPGWIE